MFPRHLSDAVDKFHFTLPYAGLVGGVLGKKNFFNIYPGVILHIVKILIQNNLFSEEKRIFY
jgi:hypothetical protein